MVGIDEVFDFFEMCLIKMYFVVGVMVFDDVNVFICIVNYDDGLFVDVGFFEVVMCWNFGSKIDIVLMWVVKNLVEFVLVDIGICVKLVRNL